MPKIREETILVSEAAKRMGISYESLRSALKAGKAPVGWAYKKTDQWVYVIPREAFERYMSGENITTLADKIIEIITNRIIHSESKLRPERSNHD